MVIYFRTNKCIRKVHESILHMGINNQTYISGFFLHASLKKAMKEYHGNVTGSNKHVNLLQLLPTWSQKNNTKKFGK